MGSCGLSITSGSYSTEPPHSAVLPAAAASSPNLLWAFIQALGKDVIKTALGEADPFKQPLHFK